MLVKTNSCSGVVAFVRCLKWVHANVHVHIESEIIWYIYWRAFWLFMMWHLFVLFYINIVNLQPFAIYWIYKETLAASTDWRIFSVVAQFSNLTSYQMGSEIQRRCLGDAIFRWYQETIVWVDCYEYSAELSKSNVQLQSWLWVNM